MIGYKVMRKLKNGYAPLFIHRKARYALGDWQRAETTENIPSGFAYRPGFHIFPRREDIHLAVVKDRVIVEVEYRHFYEVPMPGRPHITWHIAKYMKVQREVQ